MPHRNARTTSTTRQKMANSNESTRELAKRYQVSEATAHKWRYRDNPQDASHTPHHLQTTLTAAQETVVVELRKTLLLSLDDLLTVTRDFLCPKASRSGLDRCLRRHGVSRLRDLIPTQPKGSSKPLNADDIGNFYINIKCLPKTQDEPQDNYLFIAIDRATRWVYLTIKRDNTATCARAFLKALHKESPLKIKSVLTNNSKAFSDDPFTSNEHKTGQYQFDLLCSTLDIEHRLMPPRASQTSGTTEPFNGRIADVLCSNRFHDGEDLKQTLKRYVTLYNQEITQSVLHGSTPLETMKKRYKTHPHLFNKRPYNHTVLNN